MTTVDLSCIQFWQPPLNSSSFKQHTISPYTHKNNKSSSQTSFYNQPASSDKADDRRDSQTKSVVTAAQYKKCYNNTNCDNEINNDPPSIDEFLAQISSEGISTSGYQNSEDTFEPFEELALNTSSSRFNPKQPTLNDNGGNTQDKPMILENDESDTPNLKANAVPTSVNAGADPAFSFNKPPDPFSHEVSWDVEDELHQLPLLDQEVLTSATASAQNQPHSHNRSIGSLQDQMNQYSYNRTIPSINQESVPHHLPSSLVETVGEGSEEEDTLELEKELLLAFEKQDRSLPLTLDLASQHPCRQSTKLLRNRINGHDQGEITHPRPEESRDTSPDQSEKGIAAVAQHGAEGIGEEQQQKENIVGVVEGIEMLQGQQQHKEEHKLIGKEEEIDELAMEEPQEQEEEEEEEEDGIDNPEDEDYSCDTDNNDNEDPRPAKRQKLLPVSTGVALTPYFEHSPLPHLKQPCSLTSASTMQSGTNNTQSPADHEHPSSIINNCQNHHHHLLRASRSPSVDSATAADYKEWPFQGFLKRTRIGSDTIYNLEFQLQNIPEHLHIPVLSKALGLHSNREIIAEAPTPSDTGVYSKIYPAVMRPRIKRIPWTIKEDETIINMRENGCSWEAIHTALPHRTKGTIQVRYSTKLKE